MKFSFLAVFPSVFMERESVCDAPFADVHCFVSTQAMRMAPCKRLYAGCRSPKREQQ
jgi:hypothetical protein